MLTQKTGGYNSLISALELDNRTEAVNILKSMPKSMEENNVSTCLDTSQSKQNFQCLHNFTCIKWIALNYVCMSARRIFSPLRQILILTALVVT